MCTIAATRPTLPAPPSLPPCSPSCCSTCTCTFGPCGLRQQAASRPTNWPERERSSSEQPKESREQQQQHEEGGREVGRKGAGKAASARRASVCGFCLLLKFTILMHCHLTVDSATRRVRRRECGCVCLTAQVCVYVCVCQAIDFMRTALQVVVVLLLLLLLWLWLLLTHFAHCAK